MSRIFLSYRREDTTHAAGRLYDRLASHFGKDQVFMDIDTIDPGEDFVEVIERTVCPCDVLIALMGKGWLTSADAEGQRRLDNPEGFVRLEIATALDRKILLGRSALRLGMLRNCHKITFASRIVFTYSGRVSEPAAIKRRYEALRGVLDERSRRLLVAAESLALGRGGISAVARATGVSRQVIARGRQELTEPAGPPPGRIRRRGGGRKRSVTKDPTLKSELERLVEPLTRGDPESPLRWTLKSVRKLAVELERRGHPTSHRMVAELLHQLGYRLQANRKTKEGTKHPDRNAKFEQINRKVKRFLAHRQPAISVDTKKLELVGDFKNNGRELRPKGDPEKVRVHDFPIPELGRATPYGVYDMARNRGWVSVGGIMTRRRLRSRRSAAGGARWGRPLIRRRSAC